MVEFFEDGGRQVEGLGLAVVVGRLALAGVVVPVGAIAEFEAVDVALALRGGGRGVAPVGHPARVDAIQNAIGELLEEGADFFGRVTCEVAGASGHLDVKIRVALEALGNAVEIVFEATEVGADDDERGVLFHEVVASGDDGGVARIFGFAVEMPLRIRRVVAVVGAVFVEWEPGVDGFGEVGVERFPDFGEVCVNRVEERIVGQDKFPVAVFDFNADLFPDFHGDGTADKCAVEGGDRAGGVGGFVAGEEIEGRGNGVELRVLAVELEGDPIHQREVPVAAGDADVDCADVDAGKEGVDGWDVFENVRMDIDLEDFFVGGRGRGGGEGSGEAESKGEDRAKAGAGEWKEGKIHARARGGSVGEGGGPTQDGRGASEIRWVRMNLGLNRGARGRGCTANPR